MVRNGVLAGPADPLREGDQIVITASDEPPIFANLLVAAGVTATPPPGKRQLVMRLNGREAEFVTPISEGDRRRDRMDLRGICAARRNRFRASGSPQEVIAR